MYRGSKSEKKPLSEADGIYSFNSIYWLYLKLINRTQPTLEVVHFMPNHKCSLSLHKNAFLMLWRLWVKVYSCHYNIPIIHDNADYSIFIIFYWQKRMWKVCIKLLSKSESWMVAVKRLLKQGHSMSEVNKFHLPQ